MRTLLWYFWEFSRALYEQLESDQERWGDEWKKRPREMKDGWNSQEVRIFQRIEEYYKAWFEGTEAMPWLKIAGLALIGWVREHYPEYSRR